MANRQSKPAKKGVFERKIGAQQRRAPRIAAIVTFTLVGFIGGAIALSTQTIVPELARAQGEISILGHAYRIESISGGIIQEVNVQEGQLVEKGQIIARLESPDLMRDIDTTKHQLKAVADRVDSLSLIMLYLDGEALDESISTAGPAGYAQSRIYLHKTQKQIAERRAESLAGIISDLEDARDLMVLRVSEKEEAVARLSSLFESGSITLVRLDAEKQALNELRGRLIDAGVELAKTRADYVEAREAPLESDLALREQTQAEIFDLQQQEDALVEQLVALHSKREELLVRAPSPGRIQSIDFPRVGEVVDAGATLFELVNTDERLIAEIKIEEADIGHIQLGDEVSIKLSTYDSRRYGEITGRIESLSPTFVVDPTDGQSYFRAVVGLDSNTVGQGALERPLRVGMTGSAEIVTDQRSMMAYLAKPVHRSLQSAFGER